MKSSLPSLNNASSYVGSRQFKPASSQLATSQLKKSKMEGYDVVEPKPPKESFSQTLKSNKKSQQLDSTVGAKNAVDQANKKTTLEQNIEEQYINGLQNEIKLLEYELKLLKDKETEEQTNFTSFFKYFNDGVPINDNIIAMKNVYSSTQRHLSETLTAHQTEVDEILIENQAIEEETKEYEERFQELQEIITKKEEAYVKEYAKYENMFFDEMYLYKECEPDQKELQKKTRYYQGEIMIFNRNRDKEALIAGRKEIMDQQALEKLRRQVINIEESILERKKEMDDRMNTDVLEHETLFLEEQNELLKKRILAMKTDLSMVQVKIQEQKFILETQAKDRENDVSQRLTLMNKIFDLKEQIEDQQKMTEGLVQQKVKELERDRVRKVEQEVEHITKRQINLFTDRNDELEKLNDDIIYNKVELEKEFIDLEIEEDTLHKRIKDSKERLHQLKVDIELAAIKERDLSEQIDPISQKIDQLSKENPKRDQRVRDLEQEIFKAEQQLDLINQFKNFNIEEAKMAYASNNQINKSIEKLVREYRKITTS
ncbi:hypothetical protein TTHERM_00196280 (macronuclear) [Tetrahymena thermophila SB210]|uniref:Uncharacterized protein n=1 Tax=Tetrahymena thermophila (strain SB210) TaxID=312017 RepID=Q23K06_TETTS|nr:hypothetical protein TTHERM_00196280 [Tetrahymena thermophila SB210]EAR97037.2 hypothetical protein TTHERM_00196280 [Tetrahymena thermophila SB210]|eukprot:XP_001017282.2 hypothetical protein TTHERM_00196280 [Tetrahymena thermophila SB210]